jgi:hypothetical protein
MEDNDKECLWWCGLTLTVWNKVQGPCDHGNET